MSLDGEAFAAALKFLSKQERFEGELRAHLNSFEEDEVESVVALLKARNLQNDDRALETYLRAHSGRKSIGAFKMEYELRKKGANESAISVALEQSSESERAIVALESKFRSNGDRDRAYRFLLSRGFTYESATKATRHFFKIDV